MIAKESSKRLCFSDISRHDGRVRLRPVDCALQRCQEYGSNPCVSTSVTNEGCTSTTDASHFRFCRRCPLLSASGRPRRPRRDGPEIGARHTLNLTKVDAKDPADLLLFLFLNTGIPSRFQTASPLWQIPGVL